MLRRSNIEKLLWEKVGIFLLIAPDGPQLILSRLKMFPTIPHSVMNASLKAG
jgi:hypothetical protein